MRVSMAMSENGEAIHVDLQDEDGQVARHVSECDCAAHFDEKSERQVHVEGHVLVEQRCVGRFGEEARRGCRVA